MDSKPGSSSCRTKRQHSPGAGPMYVCFSRGLSHQAPDLSCFPHPSTAARTPRELHRPLQGVLRPHTLGIDELGLPSLHLEGLTRPQGETLGLACTRGVLGTHVDHWVDDKSTAWYSSCSYHTRCAMGSETISRFNSGVLLFTYCISIAIF